MQPALTSLETLLLCLMESIVYLGISNLRFDPKKTPRYAWLFLLVYSFICKLLTLSFRTRMRQP